MHSIPFSLAPGQTLAAPLGFNARSVVVDNQGGAFIQFPTGQVVAPYVASQTVSFASATTIGRATSQIAGEGFPLGSPAVLVFTEENLVDTPGMALPIPQNVCYDSLLNIPTGYPLDQRPPEEQPPNAGLLWHVDPGSIYIGAINQGIVKSAGPATAGASINQGRGDRSVSFQAGFGLSGNCELRICADGVPASNWIGVVVEAVNAAAWLVARLVINNVASNLFLSPTWTNGSIFFVTMIYRGGLMTVLANTNGTEAPVNTVVPVPGYYSTNPFNGVESGLVNPGVIISHYRCSYP